MKGVMRVLGALRDPHRFPAVLAFVLVCMGAAVAAVGLAW